MEIQNVVNYCLKCTKMERLLEKRRNDIELTSDEIKEIRYLCANCRLGKKGNKIGIYKADAIMSSLEMHKKLNELSKKRNIGKKPVREKQFGVAVRNLRAEGKTIRQIAKILGISVDTVQKILKNNTSTQ